MKTIILSLLFCCVTVVHAQAADEPAVPAELNDFLLKIHAGMTIREVEAVLAPAYPKVKGQTGDWSGQTGYIDYKLNERHTLSVSSITRDGKEVVHDEILLYLYDWPSKRRLDIKVCEWEKQTDKKPAPYEIVLDGDNVEFNKDETVSSQIVIRDLGVKKMIAPDLYWGLSVVWDGKEYWPDRKRRAWNGPWEIAPKTAWRTGCSLSEYLVPTEVLTAGRHTIALKDASAESNTLTVFIETTK